MRKKTITGVFFLSFIILGLGAGVTMFVQCATRQPDPPGGGGKYASQPTLGRIYVNQSTKQFETGGKRIWINGANTPWKDWNEFGGSPDWNWWGKEFDRLREAGINATRIWINCNGDNPSITLDNGGNVARVSSTHWNNMDRLFDLAAQKKIYIMATLLSFDHFKAGNPNAAKWLAMLNSDAAVKSFADAYTVPFVERYGGNPHLWSVDICNEPDWIHENNRVSWDRISYFLGCQAAAIHKNSEVLVTVGIAYAKWNSGRNNAAGNTEGNKVSDLYLQSLFNDPAAYLDFWSPHYYSWVGEWFGVIHYSNVSGGRQGSRYGGYYGGYGWIVDADNPAKPAVIGECSAKGTNAKDDRPFIREGERPPENNITSDFLYAFQNGWQGVMPWTSNGVDGNGGLADFQAATLNMLAAYPELIFP
ncbi:MAG: hypothetical protein LBG95_03360 [Treponema sp.]|nr:hypothetical protein [Treponema sp.]